MTITEWCQNADLSKADFRPPRLFAKWYREGDRDPIRGLYFAGHVYECCDMARFFFETIPFGKMLHEQMGLAGKISFEDFRKVVYVAVALHDLGKLGNEFQRMLWEKEVWYQKGGQGPLPSYRQAYRHEFLSAYLIYTVEPIRKWVVDQVGQKHLPLVLAAVLGHHVKTNKEIDEIRGALSASVHLEQGLKQLSRILEKNFGFTAPPWESVPDLVVQGDQIKKMLQALPWRDETNLSYAVKWSTIISDTFGSFTPNTKMSRSQYVSALKERLRGMFAPVDIDYQKRIRSWGQIKDKLHPIQEGARKHSSDKDVAILASTGGGKTIAALLWASPKQRLVFTLPTTATATQVYADYGEVDDTLIHSRSAVDHYFAKSTLVYSSSDEQRQDEQEALDIFAQLQNFGKEISFTTIDQAVGCLALKRKSILWLLHVLNSQLAFDEFHSYDASLQGFYHLFLRLFPNKRTCHMSATASVKQMQYLKESRPNLAVIQDTDPNGPSHIPRYRFRLCTNEADAKKAFADEAGLFIARTGRDPKTLWLANTVARVQDLALWAKDALVYHSRFRYEDRHRIHGELINLFRSKGCKPGVTAIATQVAEISLDIAAELMLSEMCPLDALIQRLGRLNRIRFPEGVCTIVLYLPENNLPYSDKEIEDSWQLVSGLGGKVLSQYQLEELFSQYSSDRKTLDLPEHSMGSSPSNLAIRGSGSYTGILKRDFDSDPTLLRKRSRFVDLQKKQVPFFASEEMLASLNVEEYHYILPYGYSSRLGLILPKVSK